MTYRRVNAHQWEWQDGAKWRGVQVFPRTRRVIWSSWTYTGGMPVYDDGIAQSIERLLAGEAAPVNVPSEVLDELIASVRKK
jgi:hypothetical protein